MLDQCSITQNLFLIANDLYAPIDFFINMLPEKSVEAETLWLLIKVQIDVFFGLQIKLPKIVMS